MLIANYLFTLLNLAMYWILDSRHYKGNLKAMLSRISQQIHHSKVKLGDKEWFDKEQIGDKEPFPVTNLPFTS